MNRNCISFGYSKFTHTNKDGDFVMNYNEQRKLCQIQEKYYFVYGTGIGNNYIELTGHSVKPEKNVKDLRFNVTVTLNKHKKEEINMTYHDVISLFQKEKNSQQLIEITHKYLPVTYPHTHHITNGSHKLKLKPGKSPNKVINPKTGREIIIGGDTYNDLCQSKLYTC